MKSRMKVLGVVPVLVLAMIFSSGASAAGLVYGTWDGGSWTDVNTWTNTDWVTWFQATALPDIADGGYLDNTSPANPLTIAAGNTGYMDYLYLGNGADGDAGDRLDVYGALEMVDGLVGGFDTIFYGAFADLDPDSSVITVHGGGSLDATAMYSVNYSTTHTDHVVQDGGTVDIGYIWSLGYDVYASKIAYALNGGTFNLGANYLSNAWAAGSTNDYLTIDIAGGTLVIGESFFNADVAGGVILAGGVPVTAGNIGSLLNVSVTGDVATVSLVPEPASVLLLGIAGIGSLTLLRRRKV